VRELACMSKLYSHGGSTIAAGRDNYAGHVLSKLTDKGRCPGPQVEGWACRCHHNLIKVYCFKTLAALEKEKILRWKR
jgi:hypothetical protein